MTYQFKPGKKGYKRHPKPSESLKGTPLGDRPVMFISPKEMTNTTGWCAKNQIDFKDFMPLMNAGKIVVSKDGQPRQSELLSREANLEILTGLEVEAAKAAKRGETVEVLGESEVQGKNTFNPFGTGDETRKGTYIENGITYTVHNSNMRGVTDATRAKRGLPPLEYESAAPTESPAPKRLPTDAEYAAMPPYFY